MKDKQISLRLPPSMVAQLDHMAKDQNSSRSAVIGEALQHYMAKNDGSEALVASMDALADAFQRGQAGLVEKLAKGLAEMHDRMGQFESRFNDLEELQVQHLFNFLAYVAPETDEQTAVNRGRERLLKSVQALDGVRAGKVTSLLTRARNEIAEKEG